MPALLRSALAVALVSSIVTATPAAAFQRDGGEEPLPCVQQVPPVTSTATSPRIELRVQAVIDQNVSDATADRVLHNAAAAYAPLGVELVAAGRTRVVLRGDSTNELLAQVKAVFGGQRPPWAHLVFALTTTALDGGGVVGQADCIGGVAYPDRAFAIGHVDEAALDETGLTAGHELGHLMGAGHQFANCAEQILSAPYPCTIMHPVGGMSVAAFSRVNGAIVRGNAEQFAPPLGALPPPPAEPASSPPPASQTAPAPAPAADRPSGSQAARSPSRACRAARRSLARARASVRRATRTRRARALALRRRAQRQAARACRARRD